MLVVTPVGTSLLEHYREEHPSVAVDYDYLKWEPADALPKHEKRFNKLKHALRDWVRLDERYSAEIKSLLKIYQHTGEKPIVQLLATDTLMSLLAASALHSAIQDRFEAYFDPSKDIIRGLQVWNRKSFEQHGLVNMVARIRELRDRFPPGEVCINITGGYKPLIPYLTIVGQVYCLPLYYIFEDTDELIRLPQAPVHVNWSLFLKYRDVLEELAKGTYEWERLRRERTVGDDFQACIWEEEGMAELNAIGRMFWEEFRNIFLVKVRRGTPYENDSVGNRREVNEALAELYARLKAVVKGNKIVTTQELHWYITLLSDNDDLRHGEILEKDKFIFKSTRKSQVRLLYTPEIVAAGDLLLYLWDYVRGDFRHRVHDKRVYYEEFRRRLELLPREVEFVEIPLRNPEKAY